MSLNLDELNRRSHPRILENPHYGKFNVRVGKWRLGWTGFKTSRDDVRLVGQWYAYHDDGQRAYASCPGGQGNYLKGHVFDIASRPGQEVLEQQDLDDLVGAIIKARRIIAEGLERICGCIEADVPGKVLE